MHIAFLTPEYPTEDKPEGGLSAYVQKTAAALAQRGHEVTVFILGDEEYNRQEGQVALRAIKRTPWKPWLKPLSRRWWFLPLLDQVASCKKLAKAVWREHALRPIDIIQAPNYFAPGDGLRKNGRIPMVCRISWYPPFWRSLTNGPRSKLDYGWDWLDLRQVRDADLAYGPSEMLGRAYARGQGLHIERLRTPLPAKDHPVDPSFYEDRLKGLRYLLFFSSINSLKGGDLLVDAAPNIFQEHPGVHIVLVGRDDGDCGGNKIVPQIVHQVTAFKDRLHYFEAMPKSRLFSVIEHAAAVLVPSRADNYPNVCLEAQSYGRPVIASDNSSLEEMVEDGHTGFLFENGSAEGLVQACNRFLSLSQGEEASMQQSVQAHYASLASEDRIGELISLYERVIRGFKSNP